MTTNMLRRMNERTLAIILFLIAASLVGLIALLDYLLGDVVINAVFVLILGGSISIGVFFLCMMCAYGIKESLQKKDLK